MRKKKRFLSVLCALICILGLSVQSFAMPAVVGYDQLPDWAKSVLEPIPGVSNGYKIHVSTEKMNSSQKAIWNKVMTEYLSSEDYLFTFSFYKNPGSGSAFSVIYGKKDTFTITGIGGVPYASGGAYFTFCTDGSFGVYSSSTTGNNPMLLVEGIALNWSADMDFFLREDIGVHTNTYQLLDFSTLVIDDGIEHIRGHRLTIQYQYSDGTQAAPPAIQTVNAGGSYEITSPILEGYTTDKPVVSGTMPDNDLTVTVTYTAVPPVVTNYTLTVKYLYENGTQAAESVVQSIAAGTAYNIPSPTISNYDASQKTVSGTMPAQDLTIVVTYRKKEESSSSSGYPDFAPDVDWHNPFAWFDIAPNVEWHNPFSWE